MDLGIKGKKALVVGASKNIGAAIAEELAKEGCRVTVVARDEALLKKLVKKMGGSIKGHGYLTADLLMKGKPSEAAQILLTTKDSFDIVVHNIGGALGVKDILAPVGDWEKVWMFNAGIAIEMNRLLVPMMKKKKWGRLIHVSSISAKNGEPLGGAHPYAAAKAYLNAYVKGLARELAKDNIIVSSIMPGAVLSEGKYWDIVKKKDPGAVKSFIEKHYPIGRFGVPSEIASFVVFMASKHASFAAGAVIPVDGGMI